MKILIKKLYKSKLAKSILILFYNITGKKPWSIGYVEYKWKQIMLSIINNNILTDFKKRNISLQYGIGIDERIVEYPWIFANLSNAKTKFLDCGSTFNYSSLVNHELIKNKEITILTYYPEYENYNQNRISYIYSDIRNMPLKDLYFDEIVCQSTIEHIAMDNSIYGYEIQSDNLKKEKNYEYLKAIAEINRVLANNGKLLLTFPYGKFENHGFFQQFDKEMVNRIIDLLKASAKNINTYFCLYKKDGWQFSEQEKCDNAES